MENQIKSPEDVISSFETQALNAIKWESSIGHQPIKMFEHGTLKIGIQVELKSAGVPGVSFMRYVIIHYFVNQRPFKRLGLLQALSTGTVATPNLGGRPRLTEASGLPVKRARNFGSIEGAKQ